MNEMNQEPGPWMTSPQPGGLWIANRFNPNAPGCFDRLPASGAFTTEARALAAIAASKEQG